MMFGRSNRPMVDRIPDKAIDAGIRGMCAAHSKLELTFWDHAVEVGDDKHVGEMRRYFRAGLTAFFKAWGIGG